MRSQPRLPRKRRVVSRKWRQEGMSRRQNSRPTAGFHEGGPDTSTNFCRLPLQTEWNAHGTARLPRVCQFREWHFAGATIEPLKGNRFCACEKSVGYGFWWWVGCVESVFLWFYDIICYVHVFIIRYMLNMLMCFLQVWKVDHARFVLSDLLSGPAMFWFISKI